MKRENILFVNHTAVIGGGEVVLLELLEGLDKDRYRLFLAAPDGALTSAASARGVEVLSLEAPALFETRKGDANPRRLLLAGMDYLRGLRRLGALIRSVKPAVVHTNSNKAHLLGRAVTAADIPLVWHMHDLLTGEFFNPLQMRLLTSVGRKHCTRAVAVSGVVRDALLRAGFPSERIRVVHNGCRDIPPPRGGLLRESLGMDGRQKVIGMVGRLAPWKGQHILLRAIAALPDPDIRCILVGGPFFGEDAYLKRLQEMARDVRLEGRVVFTGYIPAAREAYFSFDIAVHASTLPEPFGLVVVEAMLSGKPVVASDSGGPREIIREGVDGLLFEAGCPESLAEKISVLLQDQETAADMGLHGRRRALDEFGLQRMIEGVEEVYRELLHRG